MALEAAAVTMTGVTTVTGVHGDLVEPVEHVAHQRRAAQGTGSQSLEQLRSAKDLLTCLRLSLSNR